MKNYITKLGKKFFEMITHVSPDISCKILYYLRVKKIPNLKKPKTFNEKTTWLKLNNYSNNLLVTKCTDKYEVREYLESKNCGEILNELYGVYDNFDDIDFEKLPNKFALKCTHGCAYNIICKDKNFFDIKDSKNKVEKWMKEKYGLATTELHYINIRPRIIIEKYLCDENGLMPIDYKFYCFNGKVRAILVCTERESKLRLNYYDIHWNELKYEKENWSGKKIKKPDNLDEMIKYCEILSQDFPFVRVDLYNKEGQIIFGELTFTPACCCAPYYNNFGDEKLGKMLDLKNYTNSRSIGLIGHFGGNKTFNDGQTVKTKEICAYLEDKYNININKFDTYNISKKIWTIFPKTKKTIKQSDVVILIVSSRGYKILSPIITFINKFYKKTIVDIVIGGARYKLYDKNKGYIKIANKFDKIFVETSKLEEEYRKREIFNVNVMPNFKQIEIIEKTKKISPQGLKMCTFSRVCKEKGIEDSIDSVILANEKLGKELFSLDIYGPIDPNYENEWIKIKSKLPDYIQYKGVIDSNDSSKVISNYDLMLFLTFWQGEGFPGTVIDAFAAGVPIIATDWNCNFEILKDNITAFKVDLHNIEKVSNILIDCSNNKNLILEMSNNCKNNAYEYMPDKAMKKLDKIIESAISEENII